MSSEASQAERRTHSQLDVKFSGELRSESGMGAARGSGVKEQHGEVLDTGHKTSFIREE